MNRNVIAAASVLAAAGGATGVVAAANAQDAPPTVTVTVAPTKATVQGADALKAGPTKLVFRASGKGERGFALFKLKPGVTKEQMVKAAPRIQNPAQAARYGTFVASTFITSRETYTTTVNLGAGDYMIADFTNRPAARDAFSVGTEQSTVAAPQPAATIEMGDYKFDGPSTLPSDGMLQVDNTGRKIHHALLFKLARGVDGKKVLATLKQGKEPKNSTFAGPPKALVEIVSPGTSNVVEGELPKGRSLLVCFIQDGAKKPPHAALGMAKLVTVR